MDALPLLTSLADVLGQALLVLAFNITTSPSSPPERASCESSVACLARTSAAVAPPAHFRPSRTWTSDCSRAFARSFSSVSVLVHACRTPSHAVRCPRLAPTFAAAMSGRLEPHRVAVLDDYQGIALKQLRDVGVGASELIEAHS